MKLNLGCGPDYKDGWTNVDIYESETVRPDVRASLYNLPFADDSADLVFAGHVLEHIEWQAVPEVLHEMQRVAMPGGALCIVGPDVTRLSHFKDDPAAERTLWGTVEHDYDVHLWPCSEFVVAGLMEACGIDDVYGVRLRQRRDVVRAWNITGPDIEAQFCLLGRAPSGH